MPVFKVSARRRIPSFAVKQDPWEPVNRGIRFNESVDDYLFRPVAKGYRWVMPDPLEIAVGNVFSNFKDIPITLNNLLQLKFNNALTSSMRVVVNTTAGLGGVVDVATRVGLEKHDEDFGQTLGYHGVSSGPYVVLPFFGPSSTRDAPASIVDAVMDPVFVGSFFVAPYYRTHRRISPRPLIHGQACLNRRKRWMKQRWINTNSCVKHISSGGGIWYMTATRRRKRKTKIPNKFIHSPLASKARTASRRARRIVKNKRGGGDISPRPFNLNLFFNTFYGSNQATARNAAIRSSSGGCDMNKVLRRPSPPRCQMPPV